MTPPLGQLVQSFFSDYLPVQKGLRLGSIRSYRDTMSLLLRFLAAHRHRSIAKLAFEKTSRLILYSPSSSTSSTNEVIRHARATNDARRCPRCSLTSRSVCRTCSQCANQIAAIPVKRTPLPDTHYLEREEMTALLRSMPRRGRFALRDRTLVLFLYNTGARAQEVVDLRIEHLDLDRPSKVRLHGKGDKWRLCPLWDETVKHLERLLHRTSCRGQ